MVDAPEKTVEGESKPQVGTFLTGGVHITKQLFSEYLQKGPVGRWLPLQQWLQPQ